MSRPRSTTGIEPSASTGAVTRAPGDPGLTEPHVRGLDRLHVLYKYRQMVLSATILVLGGGIVQTYTTATAYMGTAIVRAEPDSAPAIAMSTAPQGPGRIDPDAFMRSELGVLQSRDLKRRVV